MVLCTISSEFLWVRYTIVGKIPNGREFVTKPGLPRNRKTLFRPFFAMLTPLITQPPWAFEIQYSMVIYSYIYRIRKESRDFDMIYIPQVTMRQTCTKSIFLTVFATESPSFSG